MRLSRSIFLILALAFLFAQPANATRLPADLEKVISWQFPGAHVRIDGAIETQKKDLYLPLIPDRQSTSRRGKVHVDALFPDAENPVLIIYSNGWCFTKVIKKGPTKSIVPATAIPDRLRGHVLAAKFPSDLVVPDNFVLGRSLKSVAGDANIQLVDDAKAAKPEVKQGTVKPSLHHGAVFVTSPSTGNIMLVDETSFNKVMDFPTEGTPSGLAFAEGRLYIADQSKFRLLMLDPKTKQFVGQVDLTKRSAPKGVAALPNGKLLYVCESATNDVAVVETATNRVLLRTKVAAGPARLAVTPNGFTVIVLNTPAGLVSLISTLNQRVTGTIKVGAMPNAVVISKDSKTAYVSNRMSNTVSIIDLVSKQVAGSIPTGQGPTGLALSDDQSKLFVANAKDNTIAVFDLHTKKRQDDIKLPLDVDFPGALTQLPDGKILVSSESTSAIGVLNPEARSFESQPDVGHPSDEILWVPTD